MFGQMLHQTHYYIILTASVDLAREFITSNYLSVKIQLASAFMDHLY
jgi:hypothetical protein